MSPLGRATRLFASAMVCGFLLSADLRALAGPATPSRSNAAYASFLKARAILDAALRAHGAPGGDGGPSEAVVPVSGTLVMRGHFATPTSEDNYPLQGHFAFSRALDAWKYEGAVTDSSGTDRAWTLVNRDQIFSVDYGEARAATTTAADLPAYRRAVTLPLPLETLRLANRRAETLRYVGEEAGRAGPLDVISYSTDDGIQQSLAIERVSHHLQRIERLYDDRLEGDQLAWVKFSGYATPPGSTVPWPARVESRERDRTLELTVDVGHIDLKPGLTAAAFALPDTFPRSLSGWKVEAPPVADAPLTAEPIGRDLYLLPVPDLDCKVLFAEMDDHVIAFDAPLQSSAGERILAAIHARVPGKPVTFLVMSHHHEHYTGGMRAFVHAGVTLVTTPGTEAMLRERAAAAHAIQPDALQREPKPAAILVVHDHHVFEDAHHRIELYDIGPYTHHTHEYLLAYFPWEKLAYEGDLANFPEAGPAKRMSPRMRGLFDAMKSRKLDVQRVVQEWPLQGQRREGTMAEMEALAQSR